jgi:hypothetical protein
MDRYVWDEHLNSKVSGCHPLQTGPLDHYLEELPDGRHADEVRVLRDDHRFAWARHDHVQNLKPGGLRQYLTDTSNTRHRDAARQMIRGYYQ